MPKNTTDTQVHLLIQSLSDRIDELEIRQSFQDDTLDQLNTVLVQQQKDILALQKTLRLMVKRHQDLQQEVALLQPEVQDERPPHY
ncbi:SlyX protein [Allopseudospirillum japonicum]|uniref:Protein SlyX homolog n=1 Tax=Allopseudospirillum japonicum TaxID=64971 RepID=A0A1H6TSQ0_9GAMM|nr:SlyX family protein [Allopseudospirillum japonicum]SEI82286.1 SlyX protein [Allopseudospirillum japonicum]